jgi:3-phenylpropionate/trans-cinnamate dioxygenase ferredoxin reductase subunit
MAERQIDYLLIGGGEAAGNCGASLREEGAEGSILLVGREPDLPYYRPDCSKDYLRGQKPRAEALFQPPEWYDEQRIEALTKVSAVSLDPGERRVKLSNGDEVRFGRALMATGANVRRLGVPGCELEGIFYLRTLANSDAIRENASGKRVVLIGGSYIATEVAASLTELGSSCELVMLEHVVLETGFGEQAGRFFQSRLEEHGIVVHPDDRLERFEGVDGRVTKVVTQRGLELDADAVVVGAGVIPDVTLARGAGLMIGDTGGVMLDAKLETQVPGLFAAGDIADYDSVIHGRRVRIEHWDVSVNQGKAAARGMLGRDQPYDVVPYFFSDMSDWASLEYVGPASMWDMEVVRGSIDEGEFSIFYVADGQVVATLAVGRSDDIEVGTRFLTSHADVGGRLDELADPSTDLAEM